MKKLLLLPVLLLSACSPAPCDCETPSPVAAEPASHPVRGVVIDLWPEKTALLIKHEEVPGVMRAMTMLFKADSAALRKVKTGDVISARMSRQADGWWLTGIEVLPPPRA